MVIYVAEPHVLQVDDAYDARRVRKVVHQVLHDNSMAWAALYEGIASAFAARAAGIAWELRTGLQTDAAEAAAAAATPLPLPAIAEGASFHVRASM